MNWLNIAVAFIRSPAFVAASPTEQATWLCVVAFCVEQENGGKIAGGADWRNCQWQRCCGVSAQAVRSAKTLLHIEGADVIVTGYPLHQEREVSRVG